MPHQQLGQSLNRGLRTQASNNHRKEKWIVFSLFERFTRSPRLTPLAVMQIFE
jgi:hypothetical protein